MKKKKITKEEIGQGYDTIAEKIYVSDDFYNEALSTVHNWHGRILEGGVGQGVVLANILKRGRTNIDQLYGVDLSQKLLEIARVNVPEAELALGDVEDLSFQDNFFDFVVMVDTFQYLQDFDKALSETKRVLKIGGQFVVTVPNKDWLLFEGYIERRKNIQPVDDHFFTYEEMKNLLERHGFRILQYKGIDALRFYGWKHKLIDRLLAFVIPSLNKKMKKIIFICQK
jgi:ubiquinone/menaquinone biosynthesis C-methylase UbiE